MEAERTNRTPDEAGPGAAPPGGGADRARRASILESLLLVSTEPLGWEKIGQILGGLTRAQVDEVVAALKEKYPPESSGILVEEIAKGVQLRTNPANQEHVRQLFEGRPARFTRPSLETLAVIAYKQPVTRAEIEQIRGVDCAAPLKTLMERRLVKVAGKKDVPGKPFLFATTREFLETFGLAGLSELPSMRDIEEFLAAASGSAVSEAASQPGLFREAEPGPTRGEGYEIAEALRETEHGEPLVTTHDDIPEGLSHDVLAGEAGRLSEGDAGEPIEARPAWEPASTVREIRERQRQAERGAVSPDELAGARDDASLGVAEGEHAEPLVTAFHELQEGVSDEVGAAAAAMEGTPAPDKERAGADPGGGRKTDETDV
ncbi:MAG: SMC-Scp complex subunit ScpB [Gemmatimonadota bacterium]